MKHTSNALFRRGPLLPLAAALALSLSACGGGGGGAGSVASTGATVTAGKATLSGAAIDAPIANAQITITANAPLNDPGATTVGTITANGSGQFSVAVTLPSANVPIFANAVDPTNTSVILSSYLGSSSALSTAGTLTSANLPDLDISPVTTAALAVYAQTNGNSYAGLIPAAYATTLQTYRSDILAIAAAIKAVGDRLCTPQLALTSTANLANSIAAASNLTSGNGTTLSTAATTLGGNCPNILASLPLEISADPSFGPQLDLGDVIDAGVQSVMPGTYELQGVIAETGLTGAGSLAAGTNTATTAAPPIVLTDTAVNVDAAGGVTSTDGSVKGTLVGNLISLTVTDGAQIYNLRGKIGSIPTALVSSGQAYAVQSGGINSATSVLTNFEAVLAPVGATPVWTGIATPSNSQADGVGCTAGFPVRLDAFGEGIGGGSVGECIAPSATGWTMTASNSTGAAFNFDDNATSTALPSLSAPSWMEVTSDPFILTVASARFTHNASTTSGTTYYVMGTQSVIFASSMGNSLLSMHGSGLPQVSEASSNGLHAGDSQQQQQQDH